ncbi:MAG: ABC transporter ATP-binding protein [Eubacterium sp.]|nr:ABC transporter ATP-binding protein [Eubacterium sp.]
MERKVMIQADNLKKRYRLGQINGTTLQHELQSWWAAKRGKEDPNRHIGGTAADPNAVFWALKGVTATIYAGETVGIIGENGAGKSTFLKLLSRVTIPTEGSFDLYGRITSMLEIGTGFNGELTGRENIYMNGAILGMNKAEIDAKMEQIIEFSELREFIDTPVKRYSSGMYTKLGFAVASHLDSEIMIMDKVLAVGDVAFQNKCIARMRQTAAEEGRTVLYVSHNMNQIRQLCSRCIVLSHGEVIFDGPVETAIQHYLNQFRQENIFRNYTGESRPKWLTDNRIRIRSAEYIDHDTIIFRGDEKMRLHMVLDVKDDVPGLSLRIEVSDLNNNKLGTYFLEDICDCRAGETVELEAEVDISRFTNATYNTIYCFYVRDDAGTNLNVDRVIGLSFIHTYSEVARQIQWEKENWGYLRLDGAEVKELKRY